MTKHNITQQNKTTKTIQHPPKNKTKQYTTIHNNTQQNKIKQTQDNTQHKIAQNNRKQHKVQQCKTTLTRKNYNKT